MAKIYNFSQPDTGAQETAALFLFNRAVDMLFRPRRKADPALAFGRSLSHIIRLTRSNPHCFSHSELERLKRLAQAG